MKRYRKQPTAIRNKFLSVIPQTENIHLQSANLVFDGRETIWKKRVYENRSVEINVSLSLSKGQVKIVHIDKDGNVTTVIECTPDTSTDGFVTETVSLKNGKNRFKIVGYDCEDIDLKIEYAEP